MKRWYIVYTKKEAEEQVCKQLARKNIETFLPLNNLTQESKMKKKPLLPSYVFVHVDEQGMNTVGKLKGVAGFVYYGNRPAFLDDPTVNSIRTFIKEHKDITLERTPVDQNAIISHQSDKIYGLRKGTVDREYELHKLVIPILGYSLLAESELDDRTIQLTQPTNIITKEQQES